MTYRLVTQSWMEGNPARVVLPPAHLSVWVSATASVYASWPGTSSAAVSPGGWRAVCRSPVATHCQSLKKNCRNAAPLVKFLFLINCDVFLLAARWLDVNLNLIFKHLLVVCVTNIIWLITTVTVNVHASYENRIWVWKPDYKYSSLCFLWTLLYLASIQLFFFYLILHDPNESSRIEI